MAYSPKQIDSYVVGTSGSSGPRIQPEGPGGVVPKTFGPNASDALLTLPVGTPMCFHTTNGKWEPWVNAGVAGDDEESVIRGFVYPDPVTIDSSSGGDDVLGQTLVRGQIHTSVIAAALTTLGYTAFTANLATCLKGLAAQPSPRQLGLVIEGQADVI